MSGKKPRPLRLDSVPQSERKTLCALLPIIHVRLVRAGLPRTAALVSEAVKEVGWEVVFLSEPFTDPRLRHRKRGRR